MLGYIFSAYGIGISFVILSLVISFAWAKEEEKNDNNYESY